MPVFSSIEEAKKYIYRAIQNTLINEVFWVVQAEEAEQIEDVVYGLEAYSPRLYERRWDMNDLENIVGTVKGLSLSVKNITPPSDYVSPYMGENSTPPTLNKNLSEVVEYGKGYDWYNPGPRPFTEATVEALKRSGDHKEALKRGLRERGIVVL